MTGSYRPGQMYVAGHGMASSLEVMKAGYPVYVSPEHAGAVVIPGAGREGTSIMVTKAEAEQMGVVTEPSRGESPRRVKAYAAPSVN